MKNISEIIDMEIAIIESQMATKGRHLISTATLKRCVLQHIEIESGNEETSYFANVGIGQALQQRLYSHGYRSVRRGYFVNLERCEDVEYLYELLTSAEATAEEKAAVSARIAKLTELRKTQLDGQTYFDEDGNIIVPMNEEEFMEKIIADAV